MNGKIIFTKIIAYLQLLLYSNYNKVDFSECFKTTRHNLASREMR